MKLNQMMCLKEDNPGQNILKGEMIRSLGWGILL